MKFGTLNNYLSAIISLHRYYGFDASYRDSYFIKTVLAGLKSILGTEANQKAALTLHNLLQMETQVGKNWSKHRIMWHAIVVSFRTMLRKSNLLSEKGADNDHLVLRRDVHRTEQGFIFNVYSSKTLKYRKRA